MLLRKEKQGFFYHLYNGNLNITFPSLSCQSDFRYRICGNMKIFLQNVYGNTNFDVSVLTVKEK